MNTRTGVLKLPIESRVRWPLAVVSAILAVTAATAGTLAHAPDPILVGRWIQNQNLPYSWRSGSVPRDIYQAAINAAASDASSTRGSQAATFAYAQPRPATAPATAPVGSMAGPSVLAGWPITAAGRTAAALPLLDGRTMVAGAGGTA